MIFRDDATGIRYELIEIGGHDYLLTEDGHAYPVIAGGDFGASAMVVAMVVVMVMAAAAAAYMQYQMGQQQKKAAKANAQMLERQATLKRQIGQSRAEDIRDQNRRMLAAQQANAAAGGVDIAPGTSPLAVLSYNARAAEVDALRAEWSGDADAEASTANANMARFQGRVAEYNGTVGAGTTLLSGLSSAGRTAYGGGAMS
jgi:hypothetical protein